LKEQLHHVFSMFWEDFLESNAGVDCLIGDPKATRFLLKRFGKTPTESSIVSLQLTQMMKSDSQINTLAPLYNEYLGSIISSSPIFIFV